MVTMTTLSRFRCRLQLLRVLWNSISHRRLSAATVFVVSMISVMYVYRSQKYDIQISNSRNRARYHTPNRLSEELPASQINNQSFKQIRMHFYNPPDWLKDSITEVYKKCTGNCSMTVGKSHAYYDKDVVIFFSHTLAAIPVKKRQGQIWVLHSREPPPLHYRHFRKWNGLFNWTMTYRRDSDILNGYAHFESRFNPNLRSPNVSFKRKSMADSTKRVRSKKRISSTAWFVSRCRAQSKREEYVAILNKTHSVDIFGACGTLKCTKGDSKCLTLLSQKYKFYLSFENSLCKDYITEKSFNFYINKIDTVPITRGFNSTYSLYLPPKSFIDTGDYDQIDKLGHFLNHLSKNITLYSRYFRWRKYYQYSFKGSNPFCELCERMHMPDVNTTYQRLYHNIHRWFFGSPNVTICKNAEDIVK